jgi:CRP-like cAMP-binding protein
MDQNEEPGDLERKIQQATRIASRINDPTTVERLSAWIQDLRQRLQQRLEARRIKQQISARAREIWEQNGRPADRDLEFWLQAESEISERRRQ